jgi:enoyl-CoA hydratase/carnithine racemase
MLASRAPLPQRFAKEVIRRSMGQTLDEGLRMESASFHDIGQTEDLEEGTTAFRERRPARFVGR